MLIFAKKEKTRRKNQQILVYKIWCNHVFAKRTHIASPEATYRICAANISRRQRRHIAPRKARTDIARERNKNGRSATARKFINM